MNIQNTKNIYKNLPKSELIKHAIKKENCKLSSNGALIISTGKYTGRSPKDKYIVETDQVKNEINWGNNNQKMSVEKFNYIYSEITRYLSEKDIYIANLYTGYEKNILKIQVINEYPSHNLFMINMLNICNSTSYEPDFVLISAPGLKLDKRCNNSEAVIAINFEKKLILIAGTEYCGEMKKAIFSVINYVFYKQKILTMHCAANQDKDGDNVALFFGLSGTGKTTLSADINRYLIGDDEHAWCDKGIFNIENGCYAKCINLNHESEPVIFDAIKFGTILENVIIDKNNEPNYFDTSITQNTRANYPLSYIKNHALNKLAKHPSTIFFLSADAKGVLPPIAKLNFKQTIRFFLMGYTSVLAQTERDVDSGSIFSPCYAAPFLPLDPMSYTELLEKKIKKYNPNIYLINTGWIEGEMSKGTKRIKLYLTRKLVELALNNSINEFEIEPHFNLSIPKNIPNIDNNIFQPIKMWQDKTLYEKKVLEIKLEFNKNLVKYNFDDNF